MQAAVRNEAREFIETSASYISGIFSNLDDVTERVTAAVLDWLETENKTVEAHKAKQRELTKKAMQSALGVGLTGSTSDLETHLMMLHQIAGLKKLRSADGVAWTTY